MNYSITKNGKPLDKKLYTFDEETKTFSSNENNLVLDFSDIEGCTFDTGFGCTFKTGFGCTFKTGFDCTFKTSYDCVVVRRDIYEVIELKENQKIKLNGYVIKGFTILDNEPVKTNPKEITIDGAVYILKN